MYVFNRSGASPKKAVVVVTHQAFMGVIKPFKNTYITPSAVSLTTPSEDTQHPNCNGPALLGRLF